MKSHARDIRLASFIIGPEPIRRTTAKVPLTEIYFRPGPSKALLCTVLALPPQ
jgi:hypothetical protein